MAKREMHPNSIANLKPIEKGQPSLNPSGMSAEVRAKVAANAERTARMQEIQTRALVQVLEKMEREERFEDIAEYIRSDTNTFSRDIQDRAWGKAQGALDLTSSDGSAGPTTIRLVAAKEDGGTDD